MPTSFRRVFNVPHQSWDQSVMDLFQQIFKFPWFEVCKLNSLWVQSTSAMNSGLISTSPFFVPPFRLFLLPCNPGKPLYLRFSGRNPKFNRDLVTTRFRLILPVHSHNVTKNLTGHRMHVEGPKIRPIAFRIYMTCYRQKLTVWPGKSILSKKTPKNTKNHGQLFG